MFSVNIEHVPSDHALLREIRRLLKEDGWVYISSVIRKHYVFWLYSVRTRFKRLLKLPVFGYERIEVLASLR